MAASKKFIYLFMDQTAHNIILKANLVGCMQQLLGIATVLAPRAHHTGFAIPSV
jgi:hypothetical protein